MVEGKTSSPGFAARPLKPSLVELISKELFHSGYIGIWAWLVLRIFNGIWVAMVSPARPLTEIEQAIGLWPPSLPLAAWLERVLLAPWMRWDTLWFHRIVVEGYQAGDGSSAFHPLFPLMAKPLYWLGLNPDLSLILVSSAASLVMLYLLERLARQDMTGQQARVGILLFLSFPVALVLYAPYTEGLFLLWVVLTFWWARQKRWWLAALAASLATLTRQQGLLLALPLAWELWEAGGRNLQKSLAGWKDWLSLSLIPASMAGWLVYRTFGVGEFVGKIQKIQDVISSLIVPVSSSKVAAENSFLWPWQSIGFAWKKFFESPDLDLGVNLFLGFVFVVFMLVGWKRMRPSYRVYSLFIALVSFSHHSGPVHPSMGLPRHLWLAFPVFLSLSPAIRARWLQVTLISLGLLGMLFLLILYTLEAWVP